MENLINIYGVTLAPNITKEKLVSVKTDLVKKEVFIERAYFDSDDDFAQPKKHVTLITEENKDALKFHLADEDIKRIKANMGW